VVNHAFGNRSPAPDRHQAAFFSLTLAHLNRWAAAILRRADADIVRLMGLEPFAKASEAYGSVAKERLNTRSTQLNTSAAPPLWAPARIMATQHNFSSTSAQLSERSERARASTQRNANAAPAPAYVTLQASSPHENAS
jgi:hypothetical protein